MSESPSQPQAASISPELPSPTELPQPTLAVQDLTAEELAVQDNEAGLSCDVLVVGICGDGSLSPIAGQIDRQMDQAVSTLVKQEKLSAKQGECLLLPGPGAGKDAGNGPAMVLWVGLGAKEKLSREAAFSLASTSLRKLVSKPNAKVIVALAENFEAPQHDAIVAGAVYALDGQAIYRTKQTLHVPGEIAFIGVNEDSLRRGNILGDSINQSRRLVNEPASAIYPESFADVATTIAADVGLECEVWDQHRLLSENCRAILAVGAASVRAPRLVILQHHGGPSDQPPIAIVGKGVTFDSGGLSLKPSDGMKDMKCDMAGAATVVGTMRAIAKLGIKRNVIGLCGLAENMVSGSSYKLGDVIETRSGKTIEILNTDAEGRVVLADTLNVAIGFEPSAMVDLATLTGACLVALGKEVAGLMTNDQAVCDAVAEAAATEGEPVWQLPMFEMYDEKIKSKVADIKNIGEARWGGAITAAKFLENFVGETPWVHMDIAGPAFADSPLPHRDAGGTGAMVRTLVRWIESMD